MKQLTLIFLLLSLAGCSWFGGDEEIDLSAPSELVDFNQTLSVKKIWKLNIGSGNSAQGINLVPAVDGEHIYASDFEGKIIAVNASTGRANWYIRLLASDRCRTVASYV